MNELARYLNVVTRFSLLTLSACMFIWIFAITYRTYIAGLMLGICVSIINAHYLSLKIRQMTEMVMHGTSGKRINIGFFTRAAIAVLAVMAAHRFEPFDPMTTAIGIFFVPATTLAFGLFNRKQ